MRVNAGVATRTQGAIWTIPTLHARSGIRIVHFIALLSILTGRKRKKTPQAEACGVFAFLPSRSFLAAAGVVLQMPSPAFRAVAIGVCSVRGKSSV